MNHQHLRNWKNTQRATHRSSRRSGQALVEMAFVSIILITLMMGIIQYGILYNATIQLTNIAREGARYAAIHGTNSDVVTDTKDHIRNNIAKGTTIRTQGLPAANIAVTKDSDAGKGDPITVTLTFDMTSKFILPYNPARPGAWGGLVNTNNRWSQYKSSATMIIE